MRTTIVVAPPPPVPAKKDDGGAAVLLLLFLAIVGVFFWQLAKQRHYVEQRIDDVVQTLKSELPPLLVGEYITKTEMREYRRRIEELEGRSANLERRLEMISRRKPPV